MVSTKSDFLFIESIVLFERFFKKSLFPVCGSKNGVRKYDILTLVAIF